jgi:hypothetical protein
MRAQIAASSGLFALNREISVCLRLRGGAGRTRTSNQTIISSWLAKCPKWRVAVCTRSDGSSWTLTFKDVVDRATALELRYNLNDCVELRSGAPEQSNEASTCKRHAPQAQRAKMTEYRTWFHERHWPAHA